MIRVQLILSRSHKAFQATAPPPKRPKTHHVLILNTGKHQDPRQKENTTILAGRGEKVSVRVRVRLSVRVRVRLRVRVRVRESEGESEGEGEDESEGECESEGWGEGEGYDGCFFELGFRILMQ